MAATEFARSRRSPARAEPHDLVLDPPCGTWHVRVGWTTRKGKDLAVPKQPQADALNVLAARVHERARAAADVSYTRQLLDRGIAHCAKKLGEEAVETVVAAVGEDRDRVIAEAADLLYHLLVVLEARGITLAEVEAVLTARMTQSGLDEKASRRGG